MVAKFENSGYKDYDKYIEYRKNKKEKDRKKIKDYVWSLVTECLFCGDTKNLVFHHVNPNEKKIDVPQSRTKKQANEEASKCWCLCSQCHIKLHQRLCDPLPCAYDTRISVP